MSTAMVSLQVCYRLLWWNTVEKISFSWQLELLPNSASFNQHSPATSVTYLSKQLHKPLCLGPPLRRAKGCCMTAAAALFPFMSVFVSMQSERRGAIFGACCGGCFYLSHPLGLVFKPWPSGSGLMRTLFQSPSPLKAWQSSACVYTENAVHQQCPPPGHTRRFKLKFDFSYL